MFKSRANPPKPYITKKASTVKTEYKTVDDVIVVDKEKDLFKVGKKRIKTKEVDTNLLAQSYAGEAGIQAIFKQAVISADPSAIGTIYDEKESITDLTGIPENLGEAKKLVEKQDQILKSLDKTLVGDAKTAEEFIASLTQEKIDSYIKARIDALNNKGGKQDE